MNKLFFVSLLFISGCMTAGALPTNYIGDPKYFYCPTEMVAVCEGFTPNNMECVCIARQYQRQVVDQIRGIR